MGSVKLNCDITNLLEIVQPLDDLFQNVSDNDVLAILLELPALG